MEPAPRGAGGPRPLWFRRCRSFVVDRLEHVDPGAAPRRQDRTDDADHHGEYEEDDQLADRYPEDQPELAERGRDQRAEEQADRDPEHAPDRGGDRALVADHAAHLPAAGADRPQQPELAGWLVDREE